VTLYAIASKRSVAVGGGCGTEHELSGDPRALDCARCEAAILANPRLARDFAARTKDVPLTEEQRAELAEAEDRQRDIAARAAAVQAAQAVAAAREAQQTDPAEPPKQDNELEPDPETPDLDKLHVKTLQKMAKDAGLDTSGTKAELIARLSE
jgi:hypothetical protein